MLSKDDFLNFRNIQKSKRASIKHAGKQLSYWKGFKLRAAMVNFVAFE